MYGYGFVYIANRGKKNTRLISDHCFCGVRNRICYGIAGHIPRNALGRICSDRSQNDTHITDCVRQRQRLTAVQRLARRINGDFEVGKDVLIRFNQICVRSKDLFFHTLKGINDRCRTCHTVPIDHITERGGAILCSEGSGYQLVQSILVFDRQVVYQPVS